MIVGNLFNGESGISDGSDDGFSKGVARTNITGADIKVINPSFKMCLSVSGNFDSAVVTLEKWLNKEWVELTDAEWKYPRVLEGLSLDVGTAFRFRISGAGAGTNIKAGVSY